MNDSIYVLILIGLGLVLAYLTSQRANKREATHNGVANIFNFIASGFVAMVLPTVLCNVFFIHPRFLGTFAPFGWNLTVAIHVILIAFSMTAIALACLIPYAILKKPELDRLAQQEDKGWTREDAETSGL